MKIIINIILYLSDKTRLIFSRVIGIRKSNHCIARLRYTLIFYRRYRKNNHQILIYFINTKAYILTDQKCTFIA